MHRRYVLKALASLALCPSCMGSGLAADDAHWGYEGILGPDNWGGMDAASAACSLGRRQSPVDIRETILETQLPPLTIAWANKAESILNKGHTIQLNIAEGSTLFVGEAKFELLQFHFHRPSEHLIEGKSFSMEVHFVHRNPGGRLAVIGALMEKGGSNEVFSKIASTMPSQEGSVVKAHPEIDPRGLLPAKLSYYRYAGSLTTPPCDEIVDWLLLTQPIQVAGADVAAFAKLYEMNARPVQTLNGRYVLRSG